MPIDVDDARGAERAPSSLTWDDQDVLLYHLSLGAGDPPTSPSELAWAYEQGLQVLPTFAVVAGGRRGGGGSLNDLPGVDIDMRAVLHGEQEVELHRPIPTAGHARAVGRVADVWDKGKAAVLRLETEVTDADDGSPLWTARSSIFVRGEGGFGGDRGPSSTHVAPERAPDHVVDTPTLPQQALLYRLNGDRNPLHADPGFAEAAGFDRPILHGLCTYGMVCRSVVDHCLDGDTSRVARFSARFGGVVLPSETLRTEVWQDDGRLLVRTSTVERGTTALSNAAIDLRQE